MGLLRSNKIRKGFILTQKIIWENELSSSHSALQTTPSMASHGSKGLTEIEITWHFSKNCHQIQWHQLLVQTLGVWSELAVGTQQASSALSFWCLFPEARFNAGSHPNIYKSILTKPHLVPLLLRMPCVLHSESELKIQKTCSPSEPKSMGYKQKPVFSEMTTKKPSACQKHRAPPAKVRRQRQAWNTRWGRSKVSQTFDWQQIGPDVQVSLSSNHVSIGGWWEGSRVQITGYSSVLSTYMAAHNPL